MSEPKTPEDVRRKAILECELGRKLAKVRKSLGYSQAQAALILGTTQPAISDYETGITTMSIHMFYKICYAFNIEPNHALSWDPKYRPLNMPSKREQRLMSELSRAKTAIKSLRQRLHVIKKASSGVSQVYRYERKV